MKRSILQLILIVVVTLPLPATDLPPARYRALVQENAPVKITDYFAKYNDEDDVAHAQKAMEFLTSAGQDAAYIAASFDAAKQWLDLGIIHRVEYRNVSERKIIAVEFGLLALDVFDNLQDNCHGYALGGLEPGVLRKSGWLRRPSTEWAFYTGVAYVVKVRFEDGEIWEADLENVAEQSGSDKDSLLDSPSKPDKNILVI